MRRSVGNTFLLASAAVAAASFAVGCEDGPSQTYSPATGTAFNNGDTPAAVDDAGAPLNGTFGGGSKTEICSGQELQQEWGAMVHQPVAPPYKLAGIDVSGGPTWAGLTVEQAENGTGPLTTFPGAPPPPKRLCQPTVEGVGGDSAELGGSIQVHWGNNSEVQMEYATATHKAYFLELNQGYVGQMTWTYTTPSDMKPHTYVWQIGQPILKDGKPYTIDWDNFPAVGPKTVAEVDELYRGIVSKFAPDLYDHQPVGTPCTSIGTCAIFPQNGPTKAGFGFRPVSMYFDTYNPKLGQPAASTLQDSYFFNIKYAPYSPAHTNLKMFDMQGPTAELSPIGDMGKDCLLQLGGTFGDLINNCIQVFQDQSVGAVAKSKVLGNMGHDDQNFTFSVVGDNQNYRPPALDLGGSRQFDVIHDGEVPQDDAVASDFQFDVRAFGPIINDTYTTVVNGTTLYKKDFHGSGAVWREWARLVQADLAARYHALHPSVPIRSMHDPACFFPMACAGGSTCTGLNYGQCMSQPSTSGCTWALNFPAGADVNNWRAPAGCTGFEGNVTDAYPNVSALTGLPLASPTTTDPSAYPGGPLNAPNNAPVDQFDTSGALSHWAGMTGFKPGTPSTIFCNDPGIYNYCGMNGDLFGVQNDMLDAAYTRVVQYLGNGDILQVPEEGRDYRYYFKMFMIAYAKYVASSASGHAGHNAASGSDPVPYFGDYKLDMDNLFFAPVGAGVSRGEFVDYDNADATHDPTDLELRTILVGTNLQAVNFFRRLDREERAVFEAIENADAKAAGQPAWALNRDASGNVVNDVYGYPKKNADVFLTNIGGSPAISGGPWSTATDAKGNPIPVSPTQPDPCNPSQPWVKNAWYCATHVDKDCSTWAPTDDSGNLLTRDNGKPLLSNYCGIWNTTPFTLGQSPIQIIDTDPLNQEAKVSIPSFDNPYGMQGNSTPILSLVPWKPQQEGVGFPVASTGTTDVFVETAQLDFTGQVITPVMDYLPYTLTNADGGVEGTGVNILAYESQDFLGDVFLCYDTVTGGERAGRPGDILGVHMYSSAQTVLDWIAAHPLAQTNCGIIVRYSPYNNYPDYIQSSVNGVRLGIDQGAGFGRVSDAVIFVPGSGSAAPT